MKVVNSNPNISNQNLKINDPYAGVPKEFIEIAEKMEAQFAEHLLGEMKKTVSKENPNSSAMNYYESLIDGKRAEMMTKGKESLGLKKVILDQIYPEHLRNPRNHAVKMYKEHDTSRIKGDI